MSDVDAIVIGAGHNGLTAGTMLARDGLKVLCLEKTNWAGGMATTKELFKGYKHSVGAWAMIVLHQEMIDLLDVEKFGFETIIPDTSYCVYGEPEDKCFIAYNDPITMANKIAEDHGPDAMRGLFDLFQYLRIYGKVADKERLKAPDAIEKLIAEAEDAETREALQRLCYASAMDIIRDYFPDPDKHRTIQGSLAAMSIDGTHMGPYTPGGATSMAFHYTASDAMNVFKLPVGGIGALSEALVRALEAEGGEVRYKAQVKRLLIEDGKAVGVELRSGETITAKVILSSIDANTTFLKLAGEEHLPLPFTEKVKEIDYRNGYIQVHMTLKEEPEFTGHLAFTNEDKLKWLMAYIPSADHVSKCWNEYKNGQIPEDPLAYCYFPSMIDPTVAPAGYHTATLFSHYFPYDTPKDKLREHAGIMADRAIEQIAKYAPNFRDSIVDKLVLTHNYFEKTFGITGGDFCHGLIEPGQMWASRPVPGYSDYRTPIGNLYMCGAACHPGPGVTCAPGYNSARTVISDLAAADADLVAAQ
jgi:phytoene dehydrogenase-like protein